MTKNVIYCLISDNIDLAAVVFKARKLATVMVLPLLGLLHDQPAEWNYDGRIFF